MKRRFLVKGWFLVWTITLSLLLSVGLYFEDLILQSFSLTGLVVFLMSLVGSLFFYWKNNAIFKTEPQTIEVKMRAGQTHNFAIHLKSSFPLYPWKVELEKPNSEFLNCSGDQQNLSSRISLELSIFGLKRGYLEQTLNVFVKDPMEIFQIKAGQVFLTVECHPSIDSELNFHEFKARIEGDVFPRLGLDSGDPLKLREYQPGDPLKRIAWKVFAKRGELITRQLEPADDETKSLVLYTYLHHDDEVVAGASLKLAEFLLEESFSLLYATNVSNRLTNNFGEFKKEVLISDSKASRQSLDEFFKNYPHIASQKQILVLYAQREENADMIVLLEAYCSTGQIMKMPCPKTLEDRSLFDALFENRKKVFRAAPVTFQ